MAVKSTDVWKCNKCNHEWTPRGDKAPPKCPNPKCQSKNIYLFKQGERIEIPNQSNLNFAESMDMFDDKIGIQYEDPKSQPSIGIFPGEMKVPEVKQQQVVKQQQQTVSQQPMQVAVPQISMIDVDKHKFMELIASFGGGKKTKAIMEMFFDGDIESAEHLNKILLLAKFDINKRRMILLSWFKEDASDLGIDLSKSLKDYDEEDDDEEDDIIISDNSTKKKKKKEKVKDIIDEMEDFEDREMLKELKRLRSKKMLKKFKSEMGNDNKDEDDDIVMMPMIGPNGQPVIDMEKNTPVMMEIKRKELSAYQMMMMMNKPQDNKDNSMVEFLKLQMESNKNQSEMMRQENEKWRDRMEQERKEYNEKREQDRLRFEQEMKQNRELHQEQMKAIKEKADSDTDVLANAVDTLKDAMIENEKERLKNQLAQYQSQLQENTLDKQMTRLANNAKVAAQLGIGGVMTEEQQKSKLRQDLQGEVLGEAKASMSDARGMFKDMFKQLRDDSVYRNQGGRVVPQASDTEKEQFYETLQKRALQRQQQQGNAQEQVKSQAESQLEQAMSATPEEQSQPEVQQQTPIMNGNIANKMRTKIKNESDNSLRMKAFEQSKPSQQMGDAKESDDVVIAPPTDKQDVVEVESEKPQKKSLKFKESESEDSDGAVNMKESKRD